jgi:hypothetical protein
MTRVIYTEKYKVEQEQLKNGIWILIHRWSLKTNKKEL